MNLYQLAENLHMTVGRLRQEMTVAEYFTWLRFYTQKDKPAEDKTQVVGNTKEDAEAFWG